jgi:hypothetical protein
LGVLAFAFAVIGSIAEAIIEKDWPREMFKYVLWFGIPLAIFALAVWS